MRGKPLQIGQPAPDFTNLPGVDGDDYSLGDFDGEVLVVTFGCNHCPYVQATVDRLIELQDEFGGKGVDFTMINANDAVNYPEDSFEKMQEYAEEWGLNFPYLRDDSQQVAKAYGANKTPENFVFDAERKLQYRGRIDDNWQEPDQVQRRDLRNALEALLSGETPEVQEADAIGCTIKWKK